MLGHLDVCVLQVDVDLKRDSEKQQGVQVHHLPNSQTQKLDPELTAQSSDRSFGVAKRLRETMEGDA